MSTDKVRIDDGASWLVGGCTINVIGWNIVAHGLLWSDRRRVTAIRTTVTDFIWICVVTDEIQTRNELNYVRVNLIKSIM